MTSVTFHLLLSLLLCGGAAGQTTSKMDNTNPLLCDIKTGACEMPAHGLPTDTLEPAPASRKPIKVVYFTDPICSACWGIEPQLRRLKLEYGDSLDIEYRMGGLLPDWSYNAGGISKPSDVAHHWDEVTAYYDMPIDGDVWLEDPLPSSYPPSIAFKAAQMQDEAKAVVFLRALREMVFMEKKNITRWEFVQQAALASGLDTAQLRADVAGEAAKHFQEDLQLSRGMGVRGFPTLFFIDADEVRVPVFGAKPYAAYEAAILRLNLNIAKKPFDASWEALFKKYPTLTPNEFSVLSGMERAQAETFLNTLVSENKLTKRTIKSGCIFSVK